MKTNKNTERAGCVIVLIVDFILSIGTWFFIFWAIS